MQPLTKVLGHRHGLLIALDDITSPLTATVTLPCQCATWRDVAACRVLLLQVPHSWAYCSTGSKMCYSATGAATANGTAGEDGRNSDGGGGGGDADGGGGGGGGGEGEEDEEGGGVVVEPRAAPPFGPGDTVTVAVEVTSSDKDRGAMWVSVNGGEMVRLFELPAAHAPQMVGAGWWPTGGRDRVAGARQRAMGVSWVLKRWV